MRPIMEKDVGRKKSEGRNHPNQASCNKLPAKERKKGISLQVHESSEGIMVYPKGKIQKYI